MSLKDTLKLLLGAVSQADLDKAVKEARAEAVIERLQADGHLAADPETVAFATELHNQYGERFERFVTTAKPTPASVRTIDPKQATDPTEAAIQAHMAEHKVPYHEAAIAVSEGGKIQ